MPEVYGIIVEYGEFEGRKTISLKRSAEDKYPFTFGKAKAKLIVATFEKIAEFASLKD